MRDEDEKAGAPGKVSRPSEKISDDTSTVTETPLPVNVARLEKQGAQFERREKEHDVIVACPFCGKRVVMHETEQWHFCLGPARCPCNRVRFSDLIVRVR